MIFNKSFFLFFILLIISFSISAAKNEDIVVEGLGRGTNENEALMAAKRNAVEKGIGTVLLSKTEIENFMMKRDMIITKTMVCVKKYNILSKTKATDGVCEIRIKAVISRSAMHDDLAAFHILLESMEKPKVMVIINENNIGNEEPTNKAAENAVIALLKSPYGFEIVDPSVVASIRKSEQKMASLSGDAAGAASIGSMYGAEVIINGNAVSRIAEELSFNLAGMKSAQADVTLRAVNCTSARIIASGNAHGANVHISPNTAGTNAISAASKKAVEKILDNIIEDWSNQINNGVPLVVTVKSVTRYRTKTSVVRTLKSFPGVVSVHVRKWDGDSKILYADVQYKGDANGFCSKANGYKLNTGGRISVTGQDGSRITLIVEVK